MSQYNTGIKAFTSGEALEARCRVKMSSATVVYADAGEDFIGVTEHACASGDVVSVKLKNVSGTFKVQAAGAFSSETVLYGAADGLVDDTESGSAQFYSLEAATNAGDIIEALPWNVSAGMGSIDLDSGYNLTVGAFNSTTKGYGSPLSHTNTGDVRFYADDVGTAFAAGSVPDVKTVLGRMLITTSQATNPVRIYGVMGQVKSYANGTSKLAEWDNEQVAGTYGYLELVRNAGTIAFDGYGVSAGLIGCVETSGTMTVGTNHTIAGLAAISKLTSDLTQTGKTAGVYVGIYDITNWSDSTARSKWGHGAYIQGSAVSNGMTIGTTTVPVTLAATTNYGLSIATTAAFVTASEYDAVKINAVQTGAAAIPVALRVNLESNVKLGNWANTCYFSLDLKTAGGAAGLGTVCCSELVMGAGATEGTFGVFEGEINCPASWTGTGPVSFLYLNTYGATAANFDTYGYLFTLTGVTSGATSMWYDHQGTAPAQTEEWIRVKTPGGDRYIALYNAVV